MKRLREVAAWGFAGLGLLVVAAQVVSTHVLVVVVGTMVTAVIYGLIMSLGIGRRWLEPCLDLARPVPAGVPLTGPGAVFKRLWPWLVALTVFFVVLALGSSGTVGGIVLGTALWQYREARWLDRWQQDHGTEVTGESLRYLEGARRAMAATAL